MAHNRYYWQTRYDRVIVARGWATLLNRTTLDAREKLGGLSNVGNQRAAIPAVSSGRLSLANRSRNSTKGGNSASPVAW